MAHFPSTILNLARESWVTVTVEKEDGTVRDMVVTMNPDLLPEDKQEGFAEKHTPTFMTGWDRDRSDWRNVKFANVQAINGASVR